MRTEDAAFNCKHKDTAASFTRHRVFSFRVLLVFLMRNLQKSLQREIACFTEAMESEGGSIPEVSKAAFCKARRKLNPSAFEELCQIVCDKFYETADYSRWHGLRVLAADGSTAELPNSNEIKQAYGVFKTRSDGKEICMGRMLTLYDTLNHITLHGALGTMPSSETSMLWKALPELNLRSNDVLVFDRYYAAHLLMFYLARRGAHFCFRMKKDWWKVIEQFYNSGEQSGLITLTLPAKDKQAAAEPGITQAHIQVRLARIELESGETEILLTSFTNTEAFSVADLKELYGLRWPIEDSYKSFKHKVCVENFSGKSRRSVLQDFYVKLFIMNLPQ
ncbi:MAG: IS4 family transposase [Parafilimonas sp.]